MDELLKKYKDDTKYKLSNATYKNMENSFIRIEKIFDKSIVDFKLDDFKSVKKICDVMNDKYSLGTQIQTIISILRIIDMFKYNKRIVDKWTEKLNELIEIRNLNQDENKMSPKEEANWIDYLELKKKYIKYVDENVYTKYISELDYKDFRDILIVGLYILLPPVRIQNYSNMIIKKASKLKKKSSISLNKKYNYITLFDNKDIEFVFNDYKTNKKLGQVVKVIKSDNYIIKLLNIYLRVRNKNITNKKCKYLFPNDSCEKIQNTNFNKIIKDMSYKITNKYLSVNMFRHIFISYLYTLKLTIEQKQKIALFMGQTYSALTHEKYNRIIDKDLTKFF